MTLHTEKPTDTDKALREDILQLVRRHLFPNTPERMLAVASQVVGQILACQNPMVLDKDRAVTLIQTNIEQGNHDFVNALMSADKARTGQTKVM